VGSSLALSYYARFKDPAFRPKIEEKCPCLKAKKEESEENGTHLLLNNFSVLC